jgi:hypothetical protein
MKKAARERKPARERSRSELSAVRMKWHPWWNIGLVLLAAAVVLTPLFFSSGWPAAHENSRYAVLLDHFREAWAHGHWYPRWLPNLNGGYGYPTFVFYQPGFFFLSLPFSWLPGFPDVVFKFLAWLLMACGGLGAFFLSKNFADRRTGLVCAAWFLLTPYLYVDLYVRNDLSELLAMVLRPWALAAWLSLDARVRGNLPTTRAAVAVAVTVAS